MQKVYSMEIAGRTLSVELGIAELANGSALIKYGDTTVLTTVTASEKPREGIDFFPLSIDYEEKMYSVGKIPGGFLKREGRPAENSVLTSRVIDRPLRPLFPKDYRNDVCLVNTVLCVEQDCSPEVTAMVGASIVLAVSDIPFNGPTGSVQVGYVDGELVINPTAEQREKSDLALSVSSTSEKVMMIEAGANEISEEIMYEGIMLAHEENKKIVEFIDLIVKENGKEKHSYEVHTVDEEIFNEVVEIITPEGMEEAVFTDFKQIRDENLSVLKEKVLEKMLNGVEEDEISEVTNKINDAMYKFEKETVRKMIYKDHKRPDGRKLDELRELTSTIDILPRTHGSAIFSRGQTKVLNIATLGAMSEVQRVDGLDTSVETKRYMHHYNFPAYSVGEARPSRGTGRREIGHGALAERALLPVLPSEEDFPYAIRTVSEILSSNGSTSQASVCGSTLALMAAGVPITRPVAGISVGLVTGETEDDFVLLTDIQGLEDFFGDMDFKVAGTSKGITAIQMDMKIKGLSNEIIKASLAQTKEARKFILEEVMLKCIDKPREDISEYAPQIELVKIKVEKIADLIGPKGKTIKKILEESGVSKIDTDDDGNVFICDANREAVKKAKAMVLEITADVEINKEYDGVVTKIMNFGAFVRVLPGKEGLVHISKLDTKRVEKVEDVVSEGEAIKVIVTAIDKQGKISLTRVVPKQ